jgi:gamma-glutamylcyclotransferase (GGCT)/AIG2-like uncharacterized protein YtfP
MNASVLPDNEADPEFCLLFVYGQLQPGRRLPRTVCNCRPDRVRGRLYDLGPHPAAVNVGSGETWFSGYVLELDEREVIAELDPYEGVEEGIYRRVRTTTESGREVWIYEYIQPLPPHARGPIDHWPEAPS